MLTKINEKLGKFTSVVRNQKGATMVEYALMLALIAAVAWIAVGNVGTQTSATYTAVEQKLTPAT